MPCYPDKNFRERSFGVYLYGSFLVGGLQKYSDIDLLVVTNRATTSEEKIILSTHLLQISGIYMKTTKPPIEMTLVEKGSDQSMDLSSSL
jgi:streptomycin 3"-adenylyltransferase